MEDKTFDLVTQLYSEMTKQFELINHRFEAIEKKLDSKADASDIIRLENVLVPKVDALLDGYIQLSEKQDEICASINSLQAKVINHDNQLTALKAAK